jgi:hypothetical protein
LLNHLKARALIGATFPANITQTNDAYLKKYRAAKVSDIEPLVKERVIKDSAFVNC